MNPKFAELKIAYYQRKLADKYAFLSISRVWHGSKNAQHTQFCTQALNAAQAVCKEFGIYDAHSHTYVNEAGEYQNALAYFRSQLNLFDQDEDIVFDVMVEQCLFWIQCPLAALVEHFTRIDDLQESIMVYNTGLNTLVAIMRMEYSFDVVTYHNTMSHL